MDRRKRLLINPGETATDAALTESAREHGIRVFPKPRVASVLNIDGSGISDREYSYALRAEFDFVVADVADGLPLFAVEFDEPAHLSNPVIKARDALKASICQHLWFPLLRIDAEYLKRNRQGTVLSWLIDVWFLEKAFYEAQDSGQVPDDEPFVYSAFFEPTETGGLGRSIALDAQARGLMFRATVEGVAPFYVPEEITTPYDAGPHGLVESICVFELADQRFIIGHAKVRDFGYFGGVYARELVGDLAVADAGERLKAFRQGAYQPASRATLQTIRRRTVGWSRQGHAASDLPF